MYVLHAKDSDTVMNQRLVVPWLGANTVCALVCAQNGNAHLVALNLGLTALTVM